MKFEKDLDFKASSKHRTVKLLLNAEAQGKETFEQRLCFGHSNSLGRVSRFCVHMMHISFVIRLLFHYGWTRFIVFSPMRLDRQSH